MKKIILSIIALAGVFSMAFAPVNTFAANTDHIATRCNQAQDDTEKAALGCGDNRTVPDIAQNIVNVVLTIVGILCVIMIVFAGQRYITANGDPTQITKSKTMIIYSIAGLIVSLLAFAITNFVIASIQ